MSNKCIVAGAVLAVIHKSRRAARSVLTVIRGAVTAARRIGCRTWGRSWCRGWRWGRGRSWNRTINSSHCFHIAFGNPSVGGSHHRVRSVRCVVQSKGVSRLMTKQVLHSIGNIRACITMYANTCRNHLIRCLVCGGKSLRDVSPYNPQRISRWLTCGTGSLRCSFKLHVSAVGVGIPCLYPFIHLFRLDRPIMDNNSYLSFI